MKYGANAAARQPNAYGWVCATGRGDRPVDVADAAKIEYGPTATVAYSDWNNPYSWYASVSTPPVPTTPAQNPTDLSNSPVAQQLVQYLKGFAQGNEGDAGIDYLTLDPTTGEAKGSVWIRSHQVAGSVFGHPITVYDWTVRGVLDLNIRSGASGYIDLGHGIRLDLATIVSILAA